MSGMVILFALTSAFLLALRDIFGRLAVRGIDPIIGTGATAVLGLPVLVLVSFLVGDFRSSTLILGWPLAAIGLAGILRIVAARTFLFASMKHIGSARASSLGSTNTFFAILLGILFLGEEITIFSGAGAAMVIFGCVLLTLSRTGTAYGGRLRDFVVGVVLALLSGLSFGVATVIAKSVVGEFASPNFANLIANLIAVFSFPSLLLVRRNVRSEVTSWSLRTWGLLMLAGSSASMGVTFTYLALAKAPVTFVAPLTQSRPLFVVLVSWMLLQAHEAVNLRVALGAIAIVSGAAILILGG